MPDGTNGVFNEVYSILVDTETHFRAQGFQGFFTAYVDITTYRHIYHYVQVNRGGSIETDGRTSYIQYQNWKIFSQNDLRTEIILFPCEGVHRQLNHT